MDRRWGANRALEQPYLPEMCRRFTQGLYLGADSSPQNMPRALSRYITSPSWVLLTT